jgi:hypothetical protein
MSDEPIVVHLDPTSPTAQWAAATARSLVTSRLHLARTGDSALIDELVQGVASEIFEDVPATKATTRAAERALSLVAALVHVGVQLTDGWAEADEVPHEELVQSLFQLLEREGVTF